MGIVSISLSQSNNMKFLLVLAAAAYVHHAPLAYHAPLVYTAPVGCQNNDGAAVPCAHGVLPYGLVPAVAPAPAAEEEAVESVEKRRPSPLLRLMLRLTLRPTHGCSTTGWDMLLAHTAMVITDIIWDTMVIIWATLPIMDTLTTMATTERGRLRPNLLPRPMPKLPQRLTRGCTIAALDMPLTPTAMVITDMVWLMPDTMDISHTLPMEAAEMATELWCPAPGNSVEVSALVLMK